MTMFKNATIYVLPLDFELPPMDEIDDAIFKHELREPGPLELETRGFVDMAGSVISGNTRLTMGAATRLLPSSVLRKALDEKIDDHERKTGRKPGKRLRAEMRDAVLGELLPKAFVQHKRTAAYFDRELRMLIVDSASAKAGEQVCSLLRDALGSFPARPLECDRQLSFMMTTWMADDSLPLSFDFGTECAMEGSGEKVSCKDYALPDLSVTSMLRSYFNATEVGLIFDKRISFVLDTKLRLRKLRFLDVARDQLDPEEDEATARDAEFALMSLELRRLIARLGEVLGWVR